MKLWITAILISLFLIGCDKKDCPGNKKDCTKTDCTNCTATPNPFASSPTEPAPVSTPVVSDATVEPATPAVATPAPAATPEPTATPAPSIPVVAVTSSPTPASPDPLVDPFDDIVAPSEPIPVEPATPSSPSLSQPVIPSTPAASIASTPVVAPAIPTVAARKTLFKLDFTRNQEGSAKELMKRAGFVSPSMFVSEPEVHFINEILPKVPAGLKDRFTSPALYLGNLSKGAYGLAQAEAARFMSGIDLAKIRQVKIEWGAIQYPARENWAVKDTQREACAIILSFGPKVGDVPYFIGFSMARTAQAGQYYRPSRYAEFGRYTGAAKGDEGQAVITTLDLDSHWKNGFPEISKPRPALSGMGFEVDTRDMSGMGFIKKIEFIE